MNSTENVAQDLLIIASDQQIELREGYAEVNDGVRDRRAHV